MKPYWLILTILLSLSACREDLDEGTDPENVFEMLWTTIDQKYCFFDEKNVDWDEIHDEYALRVDTCSSKTSLFNILGEMICELKDGHVNLYAAENVIRYWKWFEDYPANYDDEIIDKYLGTDYGISGGIRYKKLSSNVGYLSYLSFSNSFNESGLDYILNSFKDCDGIIIDVRNNSGGDLTNAEDLASRFTEKKVISGYISHKIGTGHHDFSELYPIYLEPSDRVRYQKKVVVLSNRLSYSATNAFVGTMRYLPNVTIMGDQTGGGSGFPMNSTLPNGWRIRLSSCPTYDQNKELTENGIEPDSAVSTSSIDRDQGKDSIIEAAIAFLKSNV
jgi:hypothetical protein